MMFRWFWKAPNLVHKDGVVSEAAGGLSVHKTILSDQEAKVLAFYILTKKITYRYFYCFLATLLEIGRGFGVGMEHIVIFLIKKGGGYPKSFFK